jgi:hypothetical protein
MAENIEPTTDETEVAETEVAEVEAHGSVLNLQGLGKDMDKSEAGGGACVSLVSVVNAE